MLLVLPPYYYPFKIVCICACTLDYFLYFSKKYHIAVKHVKFVGYSIVAQFC